MKVATKSKTKINTEKIRKDFPILSRDIRGKKLIYFDNAATSQKPRQVIDAISDYYSQHNANVHRGVHKLSEEATESFEAARKKVADFVNAGDVRQIVFTRNATESINIVSYSWGRRNIKKGDEVLLTQMEHHANLVPWQQLAKETGAKLKFIPINGKGELDTDGIKGLITYKTKLVSFTHVSNVLGTIKLNPKTRILVDGAQAVPHIPVSVQNIGPDFYVFTGHKMLGPTGIGILYAKKGILEEMEPFITGGDMILEVDWEKSSWNYIPWKFEAGTPNVAGAVGLGAAVDYLANLGMKNIREHEKELTRDALDKLSAVGNLVIYGPKDIDKRTGVISFNIVDKNGKVAIHPHDLASILDAEGIATRSGHHCAQPLMKVLGIPAAARASFHVYNTKEEVDALIPALEKAKRIFKIS
jgi:cysteine desulfurase/selenocysteine lyase